MSFLEMKIQIIFILIIIPAMHTQGNEMEILSVEVDGLLMRYAEISSSSTCGMEGPEEYCKLVDERMFQMQYNKESPVLCDVCDDRNETKRHPIEFAKSEDDNLWWQSPSMAQGLKYQHVNVTIDLKQVYQIVYILLRMGNSPRPVNWILERSVDGVVYYPWIFFAESPYSCYYLFQRQYPELKITITTRATPPNLEDDEIFCTTDYSQPTSLNSGEIIISLINRRKSALNQEYFTTKSVPQKLIDFLSARFIRFRFLKHLTLYADMMTHKGYLETSIYNRYFYSLRNIEVGGKCICNNHANKCDKVVTNGIEMASCICQHNTCGNNCEKCCPLFNQKPWKPIVPCEECNCNRKSKECVYNQTVATLQMSLSKMGRMEGGGVCLNCQENTEGINCEKCKKGFYRPWNVLATEQFPCQVCSCDGQGSIGDCVSNGEEIDNQKPGDCICRIGYAGEKCELCDIGYERYPDGQCLPCPCSVDGSLTGSYYSCKPPCRCKINVESSNLCKTCKNGFFNLDPRNPDGCSQCYCFGITDQCSSLNAKNLHIRELSKWKLSTIGGEKKAFPKVTSYGYLTSENNYLDKIFDSPLVYYWEAPQPFLGNWLTSYGSILRYVVKIESPSEGSQIDSPDVIIKCGTSQLFHSISSEERRPQRAVLVYLKPSYWSIGILVPEKMATKNEFMNCLVNVSSLKIKAKYYSNQNKISLLNVSLPRGNHESALNEMPFIEKCRCPHGYKGLSCESCEIGFRRVNKTLFQGRCELCSCFNHSNTCDPMTGECTNCMNKTTGFQCEECISGYFGDPKLKIQNPCQKCACPLLINQMSNKCSTLANMTYVCHGCKNNTIGSHCERCAKGYFGNPRKELSCLKCNCNDNQRSCSKKTGQCFCDFNTTGPNCEICKSGFFGNALNKNCRKCDCHPVGSVNQNCDIFTGQCPCQPNFGNSKCDVCAPGFYLKDDKCVPCTCHLKGRIQSERFCNQTSGQCYCLEGVEGQTCNQCKPGHYNYPSCKRCQCSAHALSPECDKNDGSCRCGSNVADHNCDKCQESFYWINKTHCSSCNCGEGSVRSVCDMDTGKCPCAPNVTLRDCSKCDKGYYGLSLNGCKKCPICNKGKLCNDFGQCVCPPNTVGEFCEKCDSQSWNYSAKDGCKRCDCFKDGSSSTTCNSITGQCLCNTQYAGQKCSQCKIGYYGFPTCRPCQCSKNGTIPSKLLMCDLRSGTCQCKPNVMGQTCNLCKSGTFRSSDKNSGGCFSCFCSGVTDMCEPLINFRIVEGSNYKYQITDNTATFKPEKYGSVMHLNSSFPGKFSWPLSTNSQTFVNVLQLFQSTDLSLFYKSTIMNVNIRCSNNAYGTENLIQPAIILESYNGLIELRFLMNDSLSYGDDINIELNEQSQNGQWFLTKYDQIALNKFVNLGDPNQIDINLARDIFILALLNVTSFKIQLCANKNNLQSINLKLVTYNFIETISNIGNPVTSVEKCKCNSRTSGNHCQKPIDGFYKERINLPKVLITTDLRVNLRVFVELKKCRCNGHSDLCDPNTGACHNCLHNTIGKHCELCMNGFYGEPKNSGKCQLCECPKKQYNFARTCTKSQSSPLKCVCEKNYTGLLCEKCESGFYGNPNNGIPCRACNCHPEGSRQKNCDAQGICQCFPGVMGTKCDQCAPNYVIENKSCRSCYAGCTKQLLERIDKINSNLVNVKGRSRSEIPDKITNMNIKIEKFSEKLELLNKFYSIKDVLYDNLIRFQNITDIAREKYSEAEKLKTTYNEARNKLLFILKDINETIYGEKKVGVSDDMINNATNTLQIIRDLQNDIVNVTETQLLLQDVLRYKSELDKIIETSTSLMQPEQLGRLMMLKERVEMANDINQDNIIYLKTLEKKNEEYSIRINSTAKEINIFQKQNEEIGKGKEQLQKQIHNLNVIATDFQNRIHIINQMTMIIERMIKNISSSSSNTNKLFIPDQMRKHVEEQIIKSSLIIKNLTAEFTFLHQAEQAREAYSNISQDIIDVDKKLNETQLQLNENETSLKINNLTRTITESFVNKSDLQQLKNESKTKYQDSKKHYENLKINQMKFKMNNDKIVSEIPSKSHDITSIKNNLTIIQTEQEGIQKDIVQLNESLSNFQFSKVETNDDYGDKMDISVQSLSDQFKEMINESEDLSSRIKNIRQKIKTLRESLNKAKVIADLTHGAASRSAEPIRHVSKCVRRYVTYYLPTSNTFSLEFYIKPQFPDQQSLVLFGYDNSGSISNAFAFTIERNDRYKFWYDYGGIVESIELSKKFNKNNYIAISITWKLGKWEMIIKSFADDKVLLDSVQSSSINILNSIRTGPKTNVFVGGFPSAKLADKLNLEGKLISVLKENYANSYYKGCLFGVRLMNSEFGLQDISAIDEDCKKTITIDHLLSQPFTCKLNLEHFNKFNAMDKRKKRATETLFDIHLSGNGYAMINTSRVTSGYCQNKLNKVLAISSITFPAINTETFQLVAVFANHKKDFGFVLGHRYNHYQFGYWIKTYEKELIKLHNSSQSFNWNIFKTNFRNFQENIFGIEEICDPNSYLFLGDVPHTEIKLIEKLKRLKVPNFGFTGKMKIQVNQKDVFQVLATRYVNLIYLNAGRLRDPQFHSVFISPDSNQPMEINKLSFLDILNNGFGFSFDFMGNLITNPVTLLTIELSQGKIQVEISKDLVLTLIINEHRIEKALPKSNNHKLDWGPHYIVVFLSIITDKSLLVSIVMDDNEVRTKEISASLGGQMRIFIGRNSNSRNSYYLYNLFLGQKIVDFNELTLLPPGVLLKLPPIQLRPVDILYNTIESLSSIVMPEDYPANSAWFDGISNHFLNMSSMENKQLFEKTNNNISLMIRSASLRPEMIISFNFGSQRILHVFSINGQIMLYDSFTHWKVQFPIRIVNEEWHSLMFTASSQNPEKGIKVYQDKHSFDFPSFPFPFNKPMSIEIGGFSGQNPNLVFRNTEYEVQHFTGCIDSLKLNNKNIRFNKDLNRNSIKQCPRVLEFLNTGGHILDSYSQVHSSSSLMQLKTGKYSSAASENTYIVKFKFKYTGFEHGTLLVTGDGTKFCSLTIKSNVIYLHYRDFETNEIQTELLKNLNETWHNVQFQIYHNNEYFTICKMVVNENDAPLVLYDKQRFSSQYKEPDFYFGSHPSLSLEKKVQLTQTDRNFVGCISDLAFSANGVSIPCGFEKSNYVKTGICAVDKKTYLSKIL